MEKEQELQYRFSKYLETAVKRCRKDYLKKKYKLEKLESLMDPEEIQIKQMDIVQWQYREIKTGIPLAREAFLDYLEEQVDDVTLGALKNLRFLELDIMYMKVFVQYSYREIAEIVHLQEKQVASIYNYAKKKLRKELGHNEV